MKNFIFFKVRDLFLMICFSDQLLSFRPMTQLMRPIWAQLAEIVGLRVGLREIQNIFSVVGISATGAPEHSVAVKSTLLSGFAVT